MSKESIESFIYVEAVHRCFFLVKLQLLKQNNLLLQKIFYGPFFEKEKIKRAASWAEKIDDYWFVIFESDKRAKFNSEGKRRKVSLG